MTVPTRPPYRTGTRVQRRDNPSHIGTVRAIFDTLKVRVEWDNGWIEDLWYDEIERECA